MKKAIFIFLILCISFYAKSQKYKYQQGYYKPSTNTYVKPHLKTYKNETNHDNFSTKDNLNPFTHQKGYRAKDYSIESYNYGVGKQIYSGSKSGQYYYNSKGRKVYVPKRNKI